MLITSSPEETEPERGPLGESDISAQLVWLVLEGPETISYTPKGHHAQIPKGHRVWTSRDSSQCVDDLGPQLAQVYFGIKFFWGVGSGYSRAS